MPAKTHNASQHVLTKPIPCQGGHKMYLNMRLPNPYYASEDTKFISTYVDQTHPMPARTQNVSQHVLSKPFPWQRWQKMHLNMCWPKPPMPSQVSKYVSNANEIQNVSQHVLSKPIPCQRRKKMCLNLCWPDTMRQNVFQHVSTNPSHAREDTKCISACIDQTHPMPATT